MKSAVFGLAVLLAAGSSMTPARAVEPYEINMITSLTGGAAFLGAREAESVRALEAMVNQRGGIKGRPIKVVISDDQTNPQVAVQLVNGLAAKKVPFIMGPSLTAVCQAVMPLVDKNGPVEFCLSPTIFPRAGGYTFMVAPSIDDVVPVIFRYFNNRKLTKLAVITSTDASGADFDKRLDPALAASEFKDVKLVAREHFAPGDLTVSAQMARIKAAAPDGIITFTVGTPFGTVLKGIHDAGLDSIPVYGSGGNFTFAQMKQYEPFLPKDLVLNATRGVSLDPTATGTIKRAQDLYIATMAKANMRSEYATTLPWDPLMLMLDVLRKVGTEATSDQIYAALQSTKHWDGIEGTYDFSTHDQRGLGQPATAMFRYDAARTEFVQIYPVKR